jgi:hypothetical protein
MTECLTRILTEYIFITRMWTEYVTRIEQPNKLPELNDRIDFLLPES